MVEGEGFEPSKAEPADLQSAPFDRSGTPPTKPVIVAICPISRKPRQREAGWGRAGGPMAPSVQVPDFAAHRTRV